MSLHTVFPFAGICDHDFMDITSPENEWDPQTNIPDICLSIQPVYSPGQYCTRSIT